MKRKAMVLAMLAIVAIVGSGSIASAFIDLRCDSVSMSSQTEDYHTIKFKIRNFGTDEAEAPFYSDIYVNGTFESRMTHNFDLEPQPWWRWCYHTFYYSPDGSYLTEVFVDSTDIFDEPEEQENWDGSYLSYQ
ncbi:MAG TPA: hypothetical protein VKP59_01050 [Candidatus Thermoplasmatota archaeon]|nr:hypothetical protein [Candidatus Thermoplasmatota archaeon]